MTETIIDNSGNEEIGLTEESNGITLTDLATKGILGSMLFNDKEKKVNNELKEDKIVEKVVPLKKEQVMNTAKVEESKIKSIFAKSDESIKNQEKQNLFVKNNVTIEDKFNNNLNDDSKNQNLVAIIKTKLDEKNNNNQKPLENIVVSSNKPVETKLDVSLQKETMQENTKKSMIEKLEDINKQNLSNEQKAKFYAQFVDASKLNEQKYNIKLLEQPLSLTINDQVNAIMNSNLKELGNTQTLKLYQSLNKDGKAFERHPELKVEVEKNIKSVIDEYNTKVLNQNFNGLKITYNTNDLSNKELLGKYPNELLKNIDGIATKEQRTWLQDNIKTSDLGTNLDTYSKEKSGIFSPAQKDSIEDLKTMRATILTSQKLVDEGKMDPNKLNYLKTAYTEASQMLNTSLLGTMKNMGYDIATIDMNNKLEQQRILDAQNAQDLANKKALEEKQAKELEEKSHPKVEDLFPDRGMN